MTYVSASEEFDGTYVAHWELARFEVAVGRGLFGRQKVERWYPRFPADFELPDQPGLGRGPGGTYAMRVRGSLGPKGKFGHLGTCSREIRVAEVLSCEPISVQADR